MCLLVALFKVHPEAPFVIAANRDEWLARPSTTLEVLAPGPPRIVGGRDLSAGGTWLAVNEHGVVAGLTNRPRSLGHDVHRRSRGELPLLLAAHPTAAAAVAAFTATVRAADYNGCWLLVGDRDALFYMEVGPDDRLTAVPLPPGIHVLENVALGAPSAKVAAVRAATEATVLTARGPALVPALHTMLRNHDRSADATPLAAACVHAGMYGTRSAAVVVVPASPGTRPAVHVADGPPCEAAFREASSAWFE